MINKKINKILKKYNLLFIIISFICCIIGLIFKRIDNLIIISNILFIISSIITGLPIIIKAIQAISLKIIGIELLVTIAVIGAIIIGEYSEAGIVTLLFQFGAFLELKALEKTRNEIKMLTNMSPKVAIKIENDSEIEVDAIDLEKNDLIVIKAGVMAPADGIVINGEGYFNESSITGESKLIKKKKDDFIYSGSILDNGTVYVRVTSAGEDTTFNRIITLVEEAQDSKSSVERFIDKFAKYYTPFVIILAIITLILTRLIYGVFDIDKAITILVLACPGALVIGVPVSSVAGIGRAARSHILLKGGESSHTFNKTNVIALDKTGTITYGNTFVTGFKYYGDNIDYDLGIAKGMEEHSTHPLAKAIINYGDYRIIKVNSIDTIKGVGLYYKDEDYYLGGLGLINNYIDCDKLALDDINEFTKNGSTISILAKNRKIIAIFEIGDEIRENAMDFINNLKKQGIKRIIMLTGDNESVARTVSKKIGINEFYANLLPDDKLLKIKELQGEGYAVTFIGDGINDSPSLAAANTGISMGSGTDVALETSDVVIMRSELLDINMALKISKKITRIAYENILIAILTVIFLIIGLFMSFIHLSIGMLIHEGSILLVIFNAFRLLFFKGDEKNDKN